MATIGVQMMMLKSKVEEAGPFETLRRLKEDIGFRAVEVSQIPMTPENVAEMVRAREELGFDFGALSSVVQAAEGTPDESLTSVSGTIWAVAPYTGCGGLDSLLM